MCPIFVIKVSGVSDLQGVKIPVFPLTLLVIVTTVLRYRAACDNKDQNMTCTMSLTYKVLTTSQPDYLHNLISVQSTGITRSSSLVTLTRPPVSSSLQITNRSFTYASPYLWNQLPSSFRQPHYVHCPSGSPHPAHITSSQSPCSHSSPITACTFHSRLKTHLFHKCFPPQSLLFLPDCLHGFLTFTELKGHWLCLF